jgi:hypothetical protein
LAPGNRYYAGEIAKCELEIALWSGLPTDMRRAILTLTAARKEQFLA